jgi:hypothetical protein
MTPDARALAQRQLDAYNAKNLEAFLAQYAPDTEVRLLQSGELLMQGHDAMRKRYGELFKAHPRLDCRLVNRMILGDVAIDEEHLTGYADGREAKAIAIYECRDGLISKVWFVK